MRLSAQELKQAPPDLLLGGVRTEREDARCERPCQCADQCDRKCRCDGRLLEQPLALVAEADSQRRRERRAVQERDTLLDTQVVRLDARASKRLPRRQTLAVELDKPLSDKRLEEVRQGSDLTGRSVRPGRDNRAPTLVQAIGEETGKGQETHRETQEANEPQQHRSANDIRRKRRSEAGRPRRQQRALERHLVGLADLLAAR